MNETKKMVTSVYTKYGQPRAKRDIGFTETVNWISADWAYPNKSDGSEHTVIDSRGNMTTMKYGSGREIVIDALDNDGLGCEGIMYEGEEDYIPVKNYSEIWHRHIWYSINEWTEGDCGLWKYEFIIFTGDQAPKYFLDQEPGSIFKAPESEIKDLKEVWFEHGIKQGVDCPYEYPPEEQEVPEP